MRVNRALLLLVGGLGGTALCAQNVVETAPSPVSGRINGELPSWLRFSGEDRVRGETLAGVRFKEVGDGYLLNRLRLNLEARPLRLLRFQFQAQDSRVFGQNTRPAPASQKDALDLRIGYIEIGPEEGHVAFRAGRQGLTFGEGRLVADSNWSNVGRTFDAARLTLRNVGWKGVKVDLFSGVVVKANAIDFNVPAPGAHFHGVYASLGRLAPNSSVEPYVFWRLEHGSISESGKTGALNARTIGFRWVGTLPRGLDYGIEMAHQSGTSAGDRVSAWAGHWVVGRTLPDAVHRPRFFGELNRASGDPDPHDAVRGGFDPLFPSTHNKLGLADLFTWTNLLHARAGFEFTARPALRISAAYNSYWLANARDGLYAGGKVVALSAEGSAGAHVGQQVDLQTSWALSRNTQVNAGYGRLFPGEFLRHTAGDVPYHIVFFNILQRF